MVDRRRLFKRAVLAGLACALALCGVIAWRSERLAASYLKGGGKPFPPGAEEAARREFPALVDAALHTSDGLTLRGWYAPGPRGVVIFVHGGGGNRLQLLPEARVLARHGYGFLVFDSRAHGESDGDLCTWGDREQRDVFAALDFLSARPEVDRARIAILGFSIGGSTVAQAAASDARARAVILYATWTSLSDEMRRSRGKYGPISWAPALLAFELGGVDLENVRPIDRVAAISPRPLLVIAGAEDDDTPVYVMQKLFARAGEPKELWVEPGAHHGTYLAAAPREWEERVVGFLERSFWTASAQR